MGHLIGRPAVSACYTAIATSKAELERINPQFSTIDTVCRVVVGDALAIEQPMSNHSVAHIAPQCMGITGLQFLICCWMYCEVDKTIKLSIYNSEIQQLTHIFDKPRMQLTVSRGMLQQR